MYKSNKNDKIISTPSVTGSFATSESSNLTIESGHVGIDNKDLFYTLGDAEENEFADKTIDLDPLKGEDKK